MGQDALIYLVQLARVPGSSSAVAEEDAITVYRGAETSCSVTDLSPGTNYIARVCAIRCCQHEQPEQHLQCNGRAGDHESQVSTSGLPVGQFHELKN